MKAYLLDPVVKKYIRAIKQRLQKYGWTNLSEHYISSLLFACAARTGYDICICFDSDPHVDDFGYTYYVITIEDEEIHVYE